MLHSFRHRFKPDHGFSLIELLVVILIIGVLAAIAIPSFLNQKGKANDAQAKTLARTAETAMEAYATDHDGDYSGADTTALKAIEPSINVSSNGQAYLSAASGSSSGFTVTTTSPNTGTTFSVVKAANTVTRSCSGSSGGCVNSTW